MGKRRVSISGGLAVATASLGAGILIVEPNIIYPEWVGYGLILFGFCAGALTVWWGILPLFKPPSAQEKADMPLHLVGRHIARDTQWAADYPESEDENWLDAVERVLTSELAEGRLTAWGRWALHSAIGETHRSKIEPSFWRTAGWTSTDLLGDGLVWGSRCGRDGDYADIMLFRSEVQAIWPKLPWWKRLFSSSPVKRIDHNAGKQDKPYSPTMTELWARQDEAYKRHRDV